MLAALARSSEREDSRQARVRLQRTGRQTNGRGGPGAGAQQRRGCAGAATSEESDELGCLLSSMPSELGSWLVRAGQLTSATTPSVGKGHGGADTGTGQGPGAVAGASGAATAPSEESWFEPPHLGGGRQGREDFGCEGAGLGCKQRLQRDVTHDAPTCSLGTAWTAHCLPVACPRSEMPSGRATHSAQGPGQTRLVLHDFDVPCIVDKATLRQPVHVHGRLKATLRHTCTRKGSAPEARTPELDQAAWRQRSHASGTVT